MQYINAFLVCGLFCTIGQIIYDNSKLTPGHITSIFVSVGALMDLFGIYDKIIDFGGMGARLPIISFGHSLMHGAMQKAADIGLIGFMSGIFDMVGVGIGSAVFFAFITALFCKPKS